MTTNINKLFSTWINDSNGVTGGSSMYSLRVDGDVLLNSDVDMKATTNFSNLANFIGATGTVPLSNQFVTKEYADNTYGAGITGTNVCYLNRTNYFNFPSGDIIRSNGSSSNNFYISGANSEIGSNRIGTGVNYNWKITQPGQSYYRSPTNAFKYWAMNESTGGGSVIRYYNLASTDSIILNGDLGSINLTGTLTSNNANINGLTGNTGYFNNLNVSNTLTTNNASINGLTGNTGYFNNLTLSNTLTTNNASINGLTGNTGYFNNLNTLTSNTTSLNVSSSITLPNNSINDNALSSNIVKKNTGNTFISTSGTTENLIQVNKTIGTNPNGFFYCDNYCAVGYYDLTSNSHKWNIDSNGNITGETLGITGQASFNVLPIYAGSTGATVNSNNFITKEYADATYHPSGGPYVTLDTVQTITATKIFETSSGSNTDLIRLNKNLGGVGYLYVNNSGNIGFWNTWQLSSGGNLTLQGGISATATQTINFGTNSPTMAGTNITGINASNISTGTLTDTRLSTNVPLKNTSNTFISSSPTVENLIQVNKTIGTNPNGFFYCDNYGAIGYYDLTSNTHKWNIDSNGNITGETLGITDQSSFNVLPIYTGSTGATVNSNNFITKQYGDANYPISSNVCLLNGNNVFTTASGDILRSSTASTGYFYLNSNGEIGMPNTSSGTGYWWKIQNNGYAYFRSNENAFKHWAIEGNILRYYNLGGNDSIYMTGSSGLIQNKATTITGNSGATGNDANVLKITRNTGGTGYFFASNDGHIGFTSDTSGLVDTWNINADGNCNFTSVISTKPIMSGSETSTGGLVRIGYNCAPYMTTGTRNNIMIGVNVAAGNNTTVTLMDNCVGIGAYALQNVSGTSAINEVVAIGAYSLRGLNSTSAFQNTAIGTYAGRFLTNGNSNTIIGASSGQALYGLTSSRCDRNTSIGVSALSTAGALPVSEATYVGPSGTFNNFTIPFMTGLRAGFYMYWYSSNGVPAAGTDNSVMEQIQRYDTFNLTIYTTTRPIQTGTYLGLFAPGVLITSTPSPPPGTSTTFTLLGLNSTSIVSGNMFIYSVAVGTDERFATVSSWNNTTKVLTLTTSITVSGTSHTVYFYDVSTTAQNSLKGNGIFDNMAIGIGSLMNSASNQIRMVAIGPGAGNAVGDRTSTNGRTFSSSFESVFIGYNCGNNVNVRGLCCKSIYIGSLCGTNGYATTFSNRSQNETICIGYQQNVWGDYQCCMGGTNNYWYFPTNYKAVFGVAPDINSSRTNYTETGAQGVLQIVCNSQTPSVCAISCKAYNDGFAIINFTNTAGVPRGAIAGINSTSVAYNTTSDERLKENIEDMPSQLENIQKLKPRKFNWKSSGEEDNGFIAQEYYKIYPERTNHKDLYPEEMLGMDYGRCTPYLWKGVSELIDITINQQKEINLLKEEINLLKQLLKEKNII